MDVIIKVALWAHFLAIGMGGAATFGIPIAGKVMAGAGPASRPFIGPLIEALSGLGRKAIGLLILSGAVLVWARYDVSALSGVFWVKMVLVVALIVLVVYSVRNGKKARAGDMAAASRAPVLGNVGMALFTLIVLSAALTFM